MIARHLTIACLIYAVLVLQTGVMNDLMVATFRPWLPGIALVACVLLTDGAAGLVWAAAMGFAIDCQSMDRLGVHLVVATVVASGLMAIRSDHRRVDAISSGTMVFGGTLAWRTTASVVHGLLDRHAFDVAQLAKNGCLEAIGTCALAMGLIAGGRLMMNAMRSPSISSVSLGNRWSMLTGND